MDVKVFFFLNPRETVSSGQPNSHRKRLAVLVD